MNKTISQHTMASTRWAYRIACGVVCVAQLLFLFSASQAQEGAKAGHPEIPDPPQPPSAPSLAGAPELSPDSAKFIRSEYRDGRLRATDAEGREWEYDVEAGVFRSSGRAWDIGSGRVTIRIFVDEDDTIRTDEDRDPEWARDTVDMDTHHNDDVTIESNEYVGHDLYSTGEIEINGLVDGDVVSMGRVTVGKTGWIEGDARAPRIRVKSGGVITGDQDLEAGDFAEFEKLRDEYVRGAIDLEPVAVCGLIVAIFLVVAFVMVTVAPIAVDRISAALTVAPWKSFGFGFLVLLLLGPAIGAFTVTIIGIPIALAIALAFPVAILTGLVAFLRRGGVLLIESYGKEPRNLPFQTGVGAGVVSGALLLAVFFLNSGSGFFEAWGGILLGVAGLFIFIGIFSGLGAVALTRFGRRIYAPRNRARETQPPPPTPPPVPTDTFGAQPTSPPPTPPTPPANQPNLPM